MPVRLTVRLNDNGALAVLQGLGLRVRDLAPAVDDIGRMLRLSARKRIEAAEGPEGNAWPALSEATKKKRGRNARPLQHKRHLYKSLTWRPGSAEVAVGSNRRYARIHQLGGDAGRGRTVAIPARPYLGISEDDREEIAAILLDHLGN